VVQGQKPAGGGGGVKVASAPSSAPRIDSADQRAKDSDARLILEAELRKREARHDRAAEGIQQRRARKAGSEARNHQKYLDRVAELKAALARNESDIAGIRRELGRLPAATVKQ